MSDISTSNAENRGLLASGSNLIALISFLISIVGFFVPLIVAFGLLGRGTSATSAALGSVFSNRKNNNKNQILSFINRKRKLKRRKETKLRERAELPEYYEDEEYNSKFFFVFFRPFRTFKMIWTNLVVVGLYTLLLGGSSVDALQLTEYSQVFSQYSDTLGNNGMCITNLGAPFPALKKIVKRLQ